MLKAYYTIQEGYFSDKFCEKVIKSGNKAIKDKATVIDEEGSDIRDCTVSFIKDKFILDLLGKLLKNANEHWGYEVEGVEDMQFTIYKEGQYYGWHQDTYPEPPEGMARKISFIIGLNDGYEGGELDMEIHGPLEDKRYKSVELNKGAIIFFPSFLYHRVRPVTKGTRITLVGWVCGNNFK